MKNFLGGIKKAELKIIDAGKFGNNDELVLTRLEAYHFKPKLNVYNAYDKAWDTEDGDDFDCNISDNDLWMSIPTFDDIMNSNKYIIKRLK